ncbi:hypothetical protein D9M71_305170 [compost metagenome]
MSVQGVARLYHDDFLDGRADQDRFQCREGTGNDDNDLGPGIVELVQEFLRGVRRVDVDLGCAGPEDAEHGDGKCRDIGQHHRNTVPALYAKVLQVGGKRA